MTVPVRSPENEPLDSVQMTPAHATTGSQRPSGLDNLGDGTLHEVEHVFTHFSLTLQLLRAEGEADDVIWSPRRDLDALPSVFLKAAKAGLSNLL